MESERFGQGETLKAEEAEGRNGGPFSVREALEKYKSSGAKSDDSHYRGSEIQPIDLIVSRGLSFLEGEIIASVCRWRKKGGKADLRKALGYIQLLLDLPDEDEDPIGTLQPTSQEPSQEPCPWFYLVGESGATVYCGSVQAESQETAREKFSRKHGGAGGLNITTCRGPLDSAQ